MQPWEKLVQALCEIWVEQDIKSGNFNYGKSEVEQNTNEEFNDRTESGDAA